MERRGSMSLWLVNAEFVKWSGNQVDCMMELPNAPYGQTRLVAGGLMALGTCTAQIEPRTSFGNLAQVMSTFSQEGTGQASDESYDDKDDEEHASVQLAGRGVAEVGKMTVATSLWRTDVPKSLLRVYTAWDKQYASGVRTVECPARPLKKCHNKQGTSMHCHGDPP